MKPPLGEARTNDRLIRRQKLNLLSYRGLFHGNGHNYIDEREKIKYHFVKIEKHGKNI